MFDLPAGLTALVLYVALACWQWRNWRNPAVPRSTLWLGLAVFALCLHGLSVYGLIDTSAGFYFSFFHMASLIFWVICITLVSSTRTLPVAALLPPLFIITAASIACSLFVDAHFTPVALTYPIALHIVLSVLAYSMLTIACVQAGALALQDHLLRAKHWPSVMAVLPPLQTMESLLFKMLWAGTALLALSILTGFWFYDDLHAQHLMHKVFFSLIALVVYSILLWGRYTCGWRGKTAIRWTFAGFVALMLAYFGSKLVLEMVLAHA